MNQRPEPKFKAGQIVVMNSLKKQLPFRILEAVWNDGWFYKWNRKNAAAEHMIRALTPAEVGDLGSNEYSEDQEPCIIAKKQCGCYIAVCGFDADDLKRLEEWVNGHEDELPLPLPPVISFLNENLGTYEIRPVSFVRSGGLTFGCKHGASK